MSRVRAEEIDSHTPPAIINVHNSKMGIDAAQTIVRVEIWIGFDVDRMPSFRNKRRPSSDVSILEIAVRHGLGVSD